MYGFLCRNNNRIRVVTRISIKSQFRSLKERRYYRGAVLCIIGNTILACLVHFRLVCRLLGNMSSTSDIQLLTQQFAYSKFSHIDLDNHHKNYFSIIRKRSNCVGCFLVFFSFGVMWVGNIKYVWNIKTRD